MRLGATPITSSDDLLEALGFEKDNQQNEQIELNLSNEEKLVLEIIKEFTDIKSKLKNIGCKCIGLKEIYENELQNN